jgi:hypothetical protein
LTPSAGKENSPEEIRPRQREVLRFQVASIDEQHGALDGVPEFAHVAGPHVLLEQRQQPVTGRGFLPELAVE